MCAGKTMHPECQDGGAGEAEERRWRKAGAAQGGHRGLLSPRALWCRAQSTLLLFIPCPFVLEEHSVGKLEGEEEPFSAGEGWSVMATPFSAPGWTGSERTTVCAQGRRRGHLCHWSFEKHTDIGPLGQPYFSSFLGPLVGVAPERRKPLGHWPKL